MFQFRLPPLVLAVACLVACSACESTPDDPSPTNGDSGGSSAEAPAPVSTGKAPAVSRAYRRPGFDAFLIDGRIWTFRTGSEALAEFTSTGRYEKRVTRIGAGPDGKTLIGPDVATLDSYEAAVAYGLPGFATFGEDGRLWVFETGSEALAEFTSTGMYEKRVTRIGAGPDGMTILSDDGTVMDAYMAAWVRANIDQPGFFAREQDGRLWVFREGSEALAEFRSTGRYEKRVTRVGAGPGEMTILSADGETIDAYMAAYRHGKPGFAVFVEDGRLWVFRDGSGELAEYESTGMYEKRVTRVGAGPQGMTVIAPDGETIDAYLAR